MFEEMKWFCVCELFCLAWLLLICFWLITLLTLNFVWLSFIHTSFPPMSCLCHLVMSSSLTCPLLIGWMTSSSLTSLINFLIVCLMTADLLYGSLNFRSRLSFEGSYPGSYYLGSLNLSQYIIILLWSFLLILEFKSFLSCSLLLNSFGVWWIFGKNQSVRIWILTIFTYTYIPYKVLIRFQNNNRRTPTYCGMKSFLIQHNQQKHYS